MDDLPLNDLLRVEDAVRLIDATPLERIVGIGVDLLRLEEQLTCNVLAEDVFADRDYPPFDKSLLDGYAVRAVDAGAGATLEVTGEVAAGAPAARPIGPGEALAIMTGAAVPFGADSVVPVEDATPAVDGLRVRIDRASPVGKGIAKRGSDARAGELVVRSGTALGPAQLAALAGVGAMRLHVTGDPITHVLVTGDELVGEGETPVGSQIRDSNGPMLVSLLKHLATLPGLSRVPDNRETIRSAIDQTAAEADVLLVSGGMSMGRHDHVPGVLRELGFDLQITKLRIKPGKPFVFATRKRPEKIDYVFGLPGNPVSSFVCTLRFASRLIARLRGLTPRDGFVLARLAADLPANGSREFYQPATLDGESNATPLSWKGSADVFTLAVADGLIVRPIDDPARRSGELVRVLPIPR